MRRDRNWPARGLLASWLVYWLLLIGVKLGPAMLAIWRATHAAAGKGNVNVSFSSGMFGLVVSQSGQTTWSGSAHLLALAAWIAGPPLLAWIIWATQRSRVGGGQAVGVK